MAAQNKGSCRTRRKSMTVKIEGGGGLLTGVFFPLKRGFLPRL